MAPRLRLVVTFALVAASAVAKSEQRLGLSLAALTDDEEGRSFDLDLAYSPSHWWEAGVGAGSTEAQAATGELKGTSLRAYSDVHGERVGVRGYYRQWNSSALDTDTVGGRAYVRTGALELAAIVEARGLDVDYMGGTTDPQRATVRFSGMGWGGGANYRWAAWSASAEGVFFHYGSLTRYVNAQSAPPDDDAPAAAPTSPVLPALPTLPTLPSVPSTSVPAPVQVPGLPDLAQSIVYSVPTLSGSYVTLNQGVFTRLLTAGLERSFARSTLRMDWSGARDAVLDTDINSFSVGYRYIFTPRLTGGLLLGISDSRYGSVNFGGFSFGVTL